MALGGREAEEVFKRTSKVTHEGTQSITEIEAREVEAKVKAFDTTVTVAIIASAGLRVSQHLIGFGCFLELLLSLFVIGIAIGMVLESQTPIGFLYLLLSCIPVDT